MLDTSAAAWMADKNDPDTVDAKLTELARAQSALDVEIGEWLLAAERMNLHVRFGYTTFFEYSDRKFGWDGRSAFERLRVAKKLETLEATREELRAGRITWSVVREISRVAETPDVEAEWLLAVRGRTVREVEKMVSNRAKNARPNDPKDPTLERHRICLSFTSEEYARYQDAMERERKETGDSSMTEEQAVVAAMSRGTEGDLGLAANQLAFVRKVDSDETYVQTRGGAMLLSPSTAERVACDATIVPATENGEIVAKASQTIPPAIRRQVIIEAGGRCEVPGCVKRYLDVHHRTFRSDGGTHELRFLIAICSWHHARIHDGYLQLDGDRVGGWRFRHADGSAYGSPGTPQMQQDVADAYHGLRRLGYKDTDARKAAGDAATELVDEGVPASGEAILRRALLRAGKAGRTYTLTTAHVGMAAAAVASTDPMGTTPVASTARMETAASPVASTAHARTATTSVATVHVGTPVVLEAISGLRNLGYRETEARAAVEAAMAVLADKPATLEQIVVAALKPNGAAMLARESSATYRTAHVPDEPPVCRESEAVYGSAQVVGTAIPDEFPAWLSDFLRRAMAGDRFLTVSLRRPVTTPAAKRRGRNLR